MTRDIWVGKEDDNIPIFWDKQDRNGVLYGYRNKVHTVSISKQVPKIGLNYSIKTNSGKIIDGECRSWNRNFYNLLSSWCGVSVLDATNFQDGNLNIKDTGGTVRSAVLYCATIVGPAIGAGTYGYAETNAVATNGIILGTGTGEESVDGYAIGTKVDHGVSAGQLYYGKTYCPTAAWDSDTRVLSYKLSRFFDNFSGGTITLKEIALYAGVTIVNTVYQTMLIRDLIDDFVIVDNDGAFISFIFSLTFPSTGSPLRNFYNFLFSQFANYPLKSPAESFADGYINVKRKDALVLASSGRWTLAWNNVYNSQPLNFLADRSGYFGLVNTSYTGGLIGTGNTAVSFEDYILGSQINHGTGAGQMSYGVCATPSRSWSDPIMTIPHSRTITNNSGSSITVKEIGIAGCIGLEGGYSTNGTLVMRDVIEDVAVANGESIKPIHNFLVTYP